MGLGSASCLQVTREKNWGWVMRASTRYLSQGHQGAPYCSSTLRAKRLERWPGCGVSSSFSEQWATSRVF